VRVLIDDTWNADDRSAFESGIRMWNRWTTFDCSYVTFDSFTANHFDDYSPGTLPPENTVYWEQHDPRTGYNGGTFQHFGGVPERVLSATVQIKPGLVNNAPSNTSGPFGYFNYLGTHEIGHTFGLADCLTCSNGSTIMGGTNKRSSFQYGRAYSM
jgi:hypothetical protein